MNPFESLRWCTRCKSHKSPEEFHRVGNGHHRWCKECKSKARGRVPIGSTAWPNAVRMPDLPDGPREDGCPTCRQRLEFNTDANSELTQTCSCGTKFVPIKGREKVTRYDASERRDVELARQVTSSQRRTPDGKFSHPSAGSNRPGIQVFHRRKH